MWALQVLTGLLIVCLTFGMSAGEIVDQIAAVVDEEVITFSDLQWLIDFRGFDVPDDPQQRRDFYLSILDQVIEQKLIAMEAEQTPIISITNEDVEAQITAYKKRFPSEEQFREKLTEMQMSSYEFRQLIRRQLAVNEFIEKRFKPFIIVLPNEIEEYYRQEFLPKLKELNQPIPSLDVVEESIRQILTEQRTNEELERWLRTARRRARVINLLFRKNPFAPNLPPELTRETELQKVPDQD
ncbi:MAG: SurA N-terminal domain-containing protein [Acidobacteriota bacterium]